MEEKYRKQYRTVGLTIFIISIALLVLRIISYYISIALLDSGLDAISQELISDIAFTLPCQIVILFLFPLIMYKFVLKKSTTELISFSGYNKVDWRICLLSFVLGVFVIFITFFISILWQLFLMIFGFSSSGGGELPVTFDLGYFLLTVVLTAVLPGICEEFTNRGGFLTTIRGSFSQTQTIFIIALAFGLFHQNIAQFLYTALMGGLLVYLVLKTGSVFPAIIVHFTNNFMSLCLDNLDTYVLDGKFYDFIGSSMSVLMSIAAIALTGAFLIMLVIVKLSRGKQRDVYAEYNAMVSTSGFKPNLRDNACFIGAIVTTAVATIVTFAFGL